jgi:hypothetical protein
MKIMYIIKHTHQPSMENNKCDCGVEAEGLHYLIHFEKQQHISYVQQNVHQIRRKYGYVSPLQGLLIELFRTYELSDHLKRKCEIFLPSSYLDTDRCRVKTIAIAQLFQIPLDMMLLIPPRVMEWGKFSTSTDYRAEIDAICTHEKEGPSDETYCHKRLYGVYNILYTEWSHSNDWKAFESEWLPIKDEMGGWQVHLALEERLYRFALKRLQSSYDQEKREAEIEVQRILHQSTNLPNDLISMVSDYIGPNWSVPKLEMKMIKGDPRWFIIDR